MSGLSDLFGEMSASDYIQHRPRPRRRLGNTGEPSSAGEADARRLLALVWPTVRGIGPTSEERRSGTWEMGTVGPYVGQRPPPLYLNEGEADHGSELGVNAPLAWWDNYAIIYDEACWQMLPHRRFETILHEALHAVGFIHGRRGTGRAYQKVVSRAKRSMSQLTRREARRISLRKEAPP